MTIRHVCKMDGDLLTVLAEGRDEGVAEVEAYGEAVVRAALAGGATRVLCDERKLVYTLDTFDTFEVARHMADFAPKLARVAVVCAPEGADLGAFWETVAVNRGLEVCVTTDMERARAWLAVSRDAVSG